MLTLCRGKGSCSPAARECGRTPPFPSTHLQPVSRPHWHKLELTPTAQLLLSTSTAVPGVPWPPSSPSAQAPVLSDPGPDLISPVPPWVPPQLLSASANCPALLAHAGHSQTLLPRHPPLHLERPEAAGAAPSCPQLPGGGGGGGALSAAPSASASSTPWHRRLLSSSLLSPWPHHHLSCLSPTSDCEPWEGRGSVCVVYSYIFSI